MDRSRSSMTRAFGRVRAINSALSCSGQPKAAHGLVFCAQREFPLDPKYSSIDLATTNSRTSFCTPRTGFWGMSLRGRHLQDTPLQGMLAHRISSYFIHSLDTSWCKHGQTSHYSRTPHTKHQVNDDKLKKLSIAERINKERGKKNNKGYKLKQEPVEPVDESLLPMMDLKSPCSWYPAARLLKRRVVLHVGPTNSGKTHTALQRLREAPSGLYCGPLRLLAWEVAESVNAQGLPCNLLTGQERSCVDGALHTACTVEMADVRQYWDCAVVDEIQMLGDASRGWSFTRALLGINTKELHLCGAPAAVDLVRRLVADCGDELEVRTYERLSPLRMHKKPLQSISAVKAGDCLVAFARSEIFSLKRLVEKETGMRCCVVYGSLPPEARSRQATLFNQPGSGFDVLVASDAIGMGLNLNIGRVVFTRMEKFDGEATRRLLPAEALQIGGRAGRFGTAFPEGTVTTLDPDDQLDMREVMAMTPAPVKAAGVFPTNQLLKMCARAQGGCLMKALKTFAQGAQVSSDYFLTSLVDMMGLAVLLAPVPLHLDHRLVFCLSPTNSSDAESSNALLIFAQHFHERGIVSVRLLADPPSTPPRDEEQLRQYESLHRQYDLYLWLGNRFEAAFIDMDLAHSQRQLVSECIAEGLQLLGQNKSGTKKLRKLVKKKLSALSEEVTRADLGSRNQDRIAASFHLS